MFQKSTYPCYVIGNNRLALINAISICTNFAPVLIPRKMVYKLITLQILLELASDDYFRSTRMLTSNFLM